MSKKAYRIILGLVFLLICQTQVMATWGEWLDPPTQTPICQTIGSAMTYGLYEGNYGKLYVLLPINGPQSYATQFWSYDIEKDSWEQLSNLPNSPSGKIAWQGSNLCYYRSHNSTYTGGFIFCTKGDSTNEFWCYYIDDKQWNQLGDFLGPVTKGRGMALATGDTGSVLGQPYVNIYLLKGVNTSEVNSEFQVYQFAVPIGTRGSQRSSWKYLDSLEHGNGADLTYRPSVEKLYAFQGGQGFYEYDIGSDDWNAMASYDPVAAQGSALGTWGVAGSEIISGENDYTIYDFRGANENVFDAYLFQRGEWDEEADDVPEDQADGIYHGSDLACAHTTGGRYCWMWAIFGQASSDTNWNVGTFYPGEEEKSGNGDQAITTHMVEQELVQVSPNPASREIAFKLLAPNITNSNIQIFNNTGKLIHQIEIPSLIQKIIWNTKTVERKTVTPGVYFYVVNTGNQKTFGKLVIQR